MEFGKKIKLVHSTAHRIDTYKLSEIALLPTFPSTGKAPRKGSRTPLNKNKYSEQRDEETGYGYFGARYMDYELTTMWLSVDPMADKYPNISPYAYCAWNPVKLVPKFQLQVLR